MILYAQVIGPQELVETDDGPMLNFQCTDESGNDFRIEVPYDADDKDLKRLPDEFEAIFIEMCIFPRQHIATTISTINPVMFQAMEVDTVEHFNKQMSEIGESNV